jgi:hypothetical protein|eukprot:CAMPEP_0174306534 /NCGR_PEP_ID=MMETSP0810-20121108/514_1 /TAXON_ID=73025 ORGANISM="Eutreptiella gymnastica-like, Strain CCMP1594" /NCGR_SAMPLE_ID=MMETSP0810 /ASSEMBLY_ACC=CAM_ASM_000659 /LENGTH=172 /DNA_ID=CAMNT_0015413279 /DNA_START=30 /DNA_END=548 /DNA_ORIENTATION=+
MICAILNTLILNPMFLAIGFVLPAFETFKALQVSDNKSRRMSLLMYWAVFALFFVFEDYVERLCCMLGIFYFVLKVLFVVWLQAPQFNGAEVIFEKIMKPYMGAHEDWVDAKLEVAKEMSLVVGEKVGAKTVVVASMAREAMTTISSKVSALQEMQKDKSEEKPAPKDKKEE